jgi:hypothetical protein
MEEMTNHALSHLPLLTTRFINYQTELNSIIMDAVYNAVNLPTYMEFVPVVSTMSKLVLSTASDQQKNRALYLIKPVTFSLFIRMACVSNAVKVSMMDLVFYCQETQCQRKKGVCKESSARSLKPVKSINIWKGFGDLLLRTKDNNSPPQLKVVAGSLNIGWMAT